VARSPRSAYRTAYDVSTIFQYQMLRFASRPTQRTRHAAGSRLDCRETLPLVVFVVPVVATSRVRGYDRSGQNRECDQGEQYVTDHLHRKNPLGTGRPNVRAAPVNACSITGYMHRGNRKFSSKSQRFRAGFLPHLLDIHQHVFSFNPQRKNRHPLMDRGLRNPGLQVEGPRMPRAHH